MRLSVSERRKPFALPLKHDKLRWKDDYPSFEKELGLSVTIAIVGKTPNDSGFISISDRMLSFDDQVPPVEGIVKDLTIRTPNWSFVYAADDTALVIPVWRGTCERLRSKGETFQPSVFELQDTVCDAYSAAISAFTPVQWA